MPFYLLNHHQHAKTLIQLSAVALMLAALTANYWLIMDGRYRDFAISLYALPVIQISLGLLASKQAIRHSLGFFKALGIILVASAMACLYKESSNLLAWAWLGLNLLLAVANWPKKDTSHIHH
jgi:hypothetical protein